MKVSNMPVPQEILKLVERFDAQREAYQSGKYNEAQIRAEFIDPLFKALGWDIHNEQGYAEAYKDVIHEDAIKIGGATEAPDLCFRIGGTRKFFVECKKPSVNIKDDVHPAYQLRRYAWSARLPLSILTDFDEVAVYDCRAKPNKNDSSAISRLMYFTSNQFAEKWDEFSAIFSRDAVLKGSFDKYAEGTKGKKGTASVDDAFLEEIERWRDMLARNIAMRNEKLSQRELNFSVQRIIDRIIFLRICEDRGIEPYGRLMTLRNGERVYPRLCEFFQRANERYNSGLFHFQREKDRPEAPDELTLSLKIDDTVLKDIVGNLYYPESPYEFSVLPADILGQVYERFLGKVIRLTAGHQAKVEDKPEVRKAGGVYYTPTYIVDYIVKNTVGKLLEDIISHKGTKSPRNATLKDVAKLKILDPACGSGSFLLGAYQLLLDWHLVQYMKEPEKWAKGREPKLYQHHKSGWRLTTAERKRILLNNIYGVDIDSQAVEVTKLSLLLKVLEGESQETITKQFELFHQRALPDLGSNIKCGNSLIGPDFYKDRQGELFGEDEMYRINAFDWQAEFAEIFKVGGFDAVIGNPPYVLGRETFDEAEKRYFSNHYDAFGGKYDLYIYFTEKAVRLVR
ncbi:MAG: DNA methyltransferase, partial [Verrucomicrobiota bacterium]